MKECLSSTGMFCTLLPCRETVCCLPSFTGHLLVCPFQSRQRQQNISLTCALKAGLSFATSLYYTVASAGLLLPYIPNWDGLSRPLNSNFFFCSITSRFFIDNVNTCTGQDQSQQAAQVKDRFTQKHHRKCCAENRNQKIIHSNAAGRIIF